MLLVTAESCFWPLSWLFTCYTLSAQNRCITGKLYTTFRIFSTRNPLTSPDEIWIWVLQYNMTEEFNLVHIGPIKPHTLYPHKIKLHNFSFKTMSYNITYYIDISKTCKLYLQHFSIWRILRKYKETILWLCSLSSVL